MVDSSPPIRIRTATRGVPLDIRMVAPRRGRETQVRDEATRRRWLCRLAVGWLALVLIGCPPPDDDDSAGDDDSVADDDDITGDDDATDDDDATPTEDPFADVLVSFSPGEGGGFGQEQLPDIVLGPPEGAGENGGSTHVVSLGLGGEIVMEFTDITAVDGPGADLLVFENAFVGWIETGYVAASADGVEWHEWPCDPDDADGGFPGCAGVSPVLANPANELDPTVVDEAGGDAAPVADGPTGGEADREGEQQATM